MDDVFEYVNYERNISIKYRLPKTKPIFYVDNVAYSERNYDYVDIINAYEIKDDIDKCIFLNYIIEHNLCLYTNRSFYSLLTEWKAHNILYKKGLFKKHTVDACLDNNEKWYRKLFYKIVCFIFNEK